jgi:hypothetical protein
MTMPAHHGEAPPDAPPDDEPDAEAPEPHPMASVLEAVRTVIVQLGRELRTSLLRGLAASASAVLVALVIVAAGVAMAATGAILLVQGVAMAFSTWLGSAAAGHCAAGILFLAVPLFGGWLAYRSWRR